MNEFTMRAARPGVRLVVAAVLAGVMLVALGGLGYAASGGPAAAAAEYQYGEKVTICHKGKTIRVSVNALRGHRRHGDSLAACTSADRAQAKLQEKKAKLKANQEKLKEAREKAEREDAGKGNGKK